MTGWRRYLTRWLLLAAAAAIAATAAAGKLPLPTWAKAVTVGVAALAALLLGPLQKHAAEWLERPGRQDAALAAHTRMHDRKDRLLKVRDCTDPLALGVHPAARPVGEDTKRHRMNCGTLPTYVRRDADDAAELTAGFTHGGLIIIEGASAAGKTRMAYEAMHRLALSRSLIVSDDLSSLRKLKDAGTRLTNALVWLDDISDYLAAGGLDGSVLDVLCPPGRNDVLILATLHAEARRDLDAADLDSTISRAVQEVLNRARNILLNRVLSPAERHRAEEQNASDPRITAALNQHTGAGFAEYLAAAPAIFHRWESARNGQNPTAGAIITAAVDARRAGYLSPLPRDLLKNLHGHYLDPRQAHQPAAPSFDDALTWAIHPVKGASSCLTTLGADTYEPFDYLVDHTQAAADTSPIPEPVWPILLQNAQIADLPSLSNAAWHTGRLDIAAAAFRRAARTGHPAPMYNLGILLSSTGHTQEAEQWYRKAASIGYPDAMNNLANLLRESGRAQQAEQWYREAAEAVSRTVCTTSGTSSARRNAPRKQNNGGGKPPVPAITAP